MSEEPAPSGGEAAQTDTPVEAPASSVLGGAAGAQADAPSEEVAVEGEVAAEVAVAPEPIDPESYEFTFPDGFEPDVESLRDARKAMADAGVPADKAQPILDAYVKAQNAVVAKATADFQAQQTKWETAINSMPAFQGPTREKSLQAIGAVFDQYGPEARDAFNDPRIGNNPTVVAFMHKIAQALSEGAPAAQGGPGKLAGPNGKAPSNAFGLQYPNTPEINS